MELSELGGKFCLPGCCHTRHCFKLTLRSKLPVKCSKASCVSTTTTVSAERDLNTAIPSVSIFHAFFFIAKTACLGNGVHDRSYVAVFPVISVVAGVDQLYRFVCLRFLYVQIVAQRGEPLHV